MLKVQRKNFINRRTQKNLKGYPKLSKDTWKHKFWNPRVPPHACLPYVLQMNMTIQLEILSVEQVGRSPPLYSIPCAKAKKKNLPWLLSWDEKLLIGTNLLWRAKGDIFCLLNFFSRTFTFFNFWVAFLLSSFIFFKEAAFVFY